MIANHEIHQQGDDGSASSPQSPRAPLPRLDQEALGRALEWVSCAFVLIDEDECIALSNAHADKCFGYGRGELVGQAIDIILAPECLADKPRLFDGSPTDAQEAGQTGSSRKIICKRKDGSEFAVEIVSTRIDAGAGPMTLVSIMAMPQYPQHDERFRRLVEYSPFAKLMVDRMGRIVLVNAEAERIFSYAREQLIGQSVDLLVPEAVRGHHGSYRDGFFGDAQARPMGSGRELFARRADGTEFPVEIGLNPIDTEEGTMVLAAIVDITERRRAQQKIDSALREKTILLNEVHHRVKNNLQVISSLLNLQAANAGDERLREAFNESLNRVRAMALTHQLLYERQDYSFIDLGEYLGRLTQLLQSAYRAQGNLVVDLKLEQAASAPAIRLDMERSIPCGLVVNELITNAFKHAFPGGGRGQITVVLDGTSADEISLSVNDNGIGLPPDFDIGNARSLGLQLVPMLVEQLQGRLSIASSPGAHFTIRFPRNPPPTRTLP